MSETLTVRRWRRLGADRLVVTEDTGGRVGWIDLSSGEVVVERPQLEAVVRLAAQEYLRTDVVELALGLGSDETSSRSAFAPRRDLEASADRVVGANRIDTEPTVLATRAKRGVSITARLASLVPEGWLVLQDVPVGLQGWALDHLLIGPGGVFTLREHKLPGARVEVGPTQIQVDGMSTSYLRDARLERRRVSQLLTAAVGFTVEPTAVVVLGGVARTTARTPPRADGALVLSRRDVPDVFLRMPQVLAATKVEVIRAAAGRRVTWRS